MSLHAATQPVSEEVARFLGPTATRLVQALGDPGQRRSVEQALGVLARALAAVDGLDLERLERLDEGLPGIALWEQAAPEVRAMLMAVHAAVAQLRAIFPALAAAIRTADHEPLDYERLLAGLEDETATGEDRAGDPQRPCHSAASGPGLDELVSRAGRSSPPGGSDARCQPGETDGPDGPAAIGGAIAALAELLLQDVLAFGQRLRVPAVVYERWALLGELQEFRAACTRCLEALAAAILAPLSPRPLAELLPRYLSEAQRAARLRALVADLMHDVAGYQRQLAGASGPADAALAAFVALERLQESLAAPIARFLRAGDKQQLLAFVARLRRPEASAAQPLAATLAELYSFLGCMRGVNQRQELIAADRAHLAQVQAVLAAGQPVEAALAALVQLYGRDDLLDEWLRAYQSGRAPPADTLRVQVDQVLVGLAGD